MICLVGDGGFLSSVGAPPTAVELGVPVVFVVFNNFCVTTIHTVGTTHVSRTYGTDVTTPDGIEVVPASSPICFTRFPRELLAGSAVADTSG